MVNIFLDKPKLGRRGARWIEKMEILETFHITLETAKNHVLGDELFNVRNNEAVVNDVEAQYVYLAEFMNGYDDD